VKSDEPLWTSAMRLPSLRRDLLAVRRRELLEGFLSDGQHAAGAAGTVVEEVGSRVDLIGDGEKDQSSSKTVPMPWLSSLGCFTDEV
jgi:hypothetical protein